MNEKAASEASDLAQVSIAVVDDHDLIREGLNTILTNHGAGHVEKFSSAMGLVSEMDAGRFFDFYILDLELPDLDGFVLIEMIRARDSQARIIVSTLHDELWTLRKLLARDVNAIIYKSSDGDEIVSALSEILKGHKYYCSEVATAIQAASDNSLHPTARELEVLYKIAQGKTSREIAASMFVTDNTVEAHRKALFTKLGAVNVVDLIIKAIAKGYLDKNGERR
ncbi:MAG: response regulator transcription factor [Muribaculaceae bacterium]|nr:response regulator transcription factor [Muribaculaceae bacterium]